MISKKNKKPIKLSKYVDKPVKVTFTLEFEDGLFTKEDIEKVGEDYQLHADEIYDRICSIIYDTRCDVVGDAECKFDDIIVH